jgi:hypothetical protein
MGMRDESSDDREIDISSGLFAYAPLRPVHDHAAGPPTVELGGRKVVLSPDFGIDWPLWRQDDSGDLVPTSPGELGLSPALIEEIARWFASWQLNYDPETGWLSQFAHQMCWGEARILRARIRLELGPAVEVTSD